MSEKEKLQPSDRKALQALEQILGEELPERKETDWLERGYTRNKQGQVTGVSLTGYGTDEKEISELNALIAPLSTLTQLSTLNLYNNKISEIAPLSTLTQLSRLDLSINQISEIAPLSKLTQLSTLNLYNNKISEIAPLSKLTQLSTLVLSDNQISEIAPLSTLTQLSTLNLSINQISEIAPLSTLTQLSRLDLRSNQISEIAPLSTLTQLSTLNLSSNQISEIAPLSTLTQLSTLVLSANQISEIAPLSTLTQLSTLDLSANQISEIAPLSTLTQLSRLELSANQINKLPRWVTTFKEKIVWMDESSFLFEKGLNLGKNPIQSPPPEIVKQGKEAIANYFAQLDEQAEDHLFEAKMLIVGEPGAGKTSLAWKIEDENCKLPSDDETTKGIDVKPYYFPLSGFASRKWESENAKFRLNLWDFGGQEIYKATHRFFLSKRALYALVADSRNEDTDFNYWLHIIETFGGDSPLLIVLNEKYARKKTLDIAAMKARFENIVAVLSVDLADDDKTRLRQLTKEIRHQVSKLPHIGSPVPAKWTILRNALEKDERNTITLQEYLGICAENGIKKQKDALVLSQYFHDIGVFLHFQDDDLLAKSIFLNATWATNAVYQILDDPLLNAQGGRFSRDDADKIWAAAEFAFLHSELLQLMKKFFLAYEIGTSGQFIVPQRLHASTPEYTWDKSANLILQYSYDFFMPKGLLAQFIVQMNRYIPDHSLVWQRGVILAYDGAKAEIIESYDARNIKIRISGKNKRNFMTYISMKIDEINAQYEKMKVEKLIPCNCTECKVSETPYFYEYKKLKRRLENNIHEILCEESFQKVDIRGLIDDVLDISRKEERGYRWDDERSLAMRSKIFISYSHNDHSWLERVKIHLKGLRHLDINAHAWDDTKIKSGEKWHQEIKAALAQSQAAILLISADFLASDFISDEELPDLLHAAEKDGLTILPIIVKPSLFGKTKLGEFQAVNDPSKPLAGLSESEQDDVLVKLALRVAELVN